MDLALALVGVALALAGVVLWVLARRRRQHHDAQLPGGSLQTRHPHEQATLPRTPRKADLRRSGSNLPKVALLRDVHDSEIEAQIRTGHLVDAVRLYREKNGVGVQEARAAVEAWRHRMRAS